ncbi:hypothetical protein ACIRTB_20875 [Streptomyces sp. NPDC101158]|uniref:hypothetical protein n=1 Tax=Streptomyces sp. NPDC101158 TaxID=3366117 RepID=UPI00381B6209
MYEGNPENDAEYFNTLGLRNEQRNRDRRAVQSIVEGQTEQAHVPLVLDSDSSAFSLKVGRVKLTFRGDDQAPPTAPPRSRTVSLTALMLPTRDRERWAEEWAAEWQDVRERSSLTRLAFLTRLFVRTGPALAWVLRVQKRREAA